MNLNKVTLNKEIIYQGRRVIIIKVNGTTEERQIIENILTLVKALVKEEVVMFNFSIRQKMQYKFYEIEVKVEVKVF